MTKDNNPKIYWDQLKKTDPKFTKKINKGFGDLTTIDPMWQIGKMTEVFGPVGIGWNWVAKYHYTDTLVFCEVSMKVKHTSNNYIGEFYGPVSSVQSLKKGNGKLDDEAPKKAMTDALTKCMSHLGMSADVFLGLHDSSKYIEQVKQEFADQRASKIKEVKPDDIRS